MRPPELETAWLPESLVGAHARTNLDAFEGYVARAPFPRAGAAARRFEPRIELELESGPTAAAEARNAVAAFDGRADPNVLDDLRLLVSELVTNAVRHAGAPPGATIRLAASLGAGTVRAEVADCGSGFEPAPRSAPWTQAGGWGLHLVDSLASRWGVDRHDAIRVWFEIDSKR
jgi:anti-sigma regulatory factor (Ser/Thr protein kinase)